MSRPITEEKETWWGKQKQSMNLEKMLQGHLTGKKAQKLIQFLFLVKKQCNYKRTITSNSDNQFRLLVSCSRNI